MSERLERIMRLNEAKKRMNKQLPKIQSKPRKGRNESKLIKIKIMKTLPDYLVNRMNELSFNEFTGLTDLGYSPEQLTTIWKRYWNLSGEQRFYFDAYHYEQTILKNL